MSTFGSGMSTATRAADAAREAALQAQGGLGGGTPKVAIVFASVGYEDIAAVPKAIRAVFGDILIVGGTSGGCVFGPNEIARSGVSIVVLGGDDVDVAWRVTSVTSSELVEVVPCAEQIARAADDAARRGFPHYACLLLAPGVFVDGEAFVTAVRKGAGARAQLFGALTGDDFTLDRPMVLFGDELTKDRVIMLGLFTREPVGIAARHGWRAVGPIHKITCTDGVYLCELDGRPALDVWLEDARKAGASPPAVSDGLALYLANHYELGLIDAPTRKSDPELEARELVARAPFSIRADGALQLSASIAEGTAVRILHATRADLLRASNEAAEAAMTRVGRPIAGALVLACSGRLAALGEAFPQEIEAIRRRIAAPIGGACVFGEIARNVRDADAFFNTTAVVVAFAR